MNTKCSYFFCDTEILKQQSYFGFFAREIRGAGCYKLSILTPYDTLILIYTTISMYRNTLKGDSTYGEAH